MRAVQRYLLVPAIQTALLCLIILAGAATYLQSNIWAGSRERHRDAKSENIMLTRDLSDLRARAQLAEDARRLSAATKLVEARLATPFSQAAMITDINTLARRSNLRVIHSANRMEAQDGDIAQFVQDLTLQGPYADVRYFMELVQRFEAVTLVDQLDWNRAQPGVIKARITVSTFFKREEGANP